MGRISRALDYDGLVLANAFAFCATEPKDMLAAADPIGPDNDAAIVRLLGETGGKIICGWGVHGAFQSQGFEVRKLILAAGVQPMALKLNAGGEPGHPLYISASTVPFPW